MNMRVLGEVAEKVVVSYVGPSSPYFRNEGIPFLRTGNIGDREIILDNLNYVTPEFHTQQKKSILRKDDIVVSRVISDEIKCAAIPEDLEGANCGNIIIIRPGKNINPRYLLHLIASPLAQRALLQRKVGSAQSVVNTEVLKSWKIPLPPLEEQHRIAAILDCADALRAKRRAALAKLDTLLQSTFIDMFGDPVMNPKGWEVAELSRLAEVVSGVTKSQNRVKGKDVVTVPYMRVANVQDGKILTADQDIKTIAVFVEDVKKYALQPGDILLTEGGDPDKLGRGGIWKGEIENCIHQNHVFRVRISDSNLLPEYLSALFSSQYGKLYFLKAAKQTTGIASINKTQLRSFPVLCVALELQQKFRMVQMKLEAQKLAIVKSLQELDNLFHALQQRAFQGELSQRGDRLEQLRLFAD